MHKNNILVDKLQLASIVKQEAELQKSESKVSTIRDCPRTMDYD